MLEQEKEQMRYENDRVQKEKERDRGKTLALLDFCISPSILDHNSSYSGSAHCSCPKLETVQPDSWKLSG